MAKNKKSGKKSNRVALAIFTIIFGALLLSTMFIPMFTVREGKIPFSAKDVIVASSVESIDEVDELSRGEEAAYGTIAMGNLGVDEIGAKVKATSYAALVASILGGLLIVLSVLSLILKLRLIRIINLGVAVLALLAGLATLACAMIFIVSKIEASMNIMGYVSSITKPIMDVYGINVAPFLYGLVPVVPVITTAIASKK